MVAADVVGVLMTVARHARVVVQVEAPYNARRAYILGESETVVHDTQWMVYEVKAHLSRGHERQAQKLEAETNYSVPKRSRRRLVRGGDGNGERILNVEGETDVQFEIDEWLQPRERGFIPVDADDTAKEGVPWHAHVPGGDGLQGFGDDLLGPYRLAVYQ
jgi:hypothetical protein